MKLFTLLGASATGIFLFAACSSQPGIKATAATPVAPIRVLSARSGVDGKPVMILSQTLKDPTQPQILEVYVIPSQEMDIFRIRANIPGRGVVDLLNTDGGMISVFPSLADRNFETTTTISPEQATLTGVLQGDIDLAITTALKKHSFILTVFAKNTGSQEVPVSVSWRPFFDFPSGDRSQGRLRIPAKKRLILNHSRKIAGTRYNFNLLKGKSLARLNLNECFTELDRDSQDQAVAELIDPVAHYGLKLKAISPEIKSFQVYAPTNQRFAAIGPDPGIVRLPPGETTKYAIELELFTPSR